MATATLVKDNLKNFTGHATLYRMEPPIVQFDWDDDYENHLLKPHDYVVVSTASMFGLETFIFPASGDGEVVSWVELSGSSKGISSHEEVLCRAGYELAKEVA